MKRVKGQSMVELAVMLIITIPALLLLIDCSFLMIGVVVNDAACRDAARAAASGHPGLLAEGQARPCGSGTMPHKRAQAVIKRVYAPKGVMQIRDNIRVLETVKAPLPVNGGDVIGEVRVETTADVFPPFIVPLIVGPTVTIKKDESYAFTYVVPYTGS